MKTTDYPITIWLFLFLTIFTLVSILVMVSSIKAIIELKKSISWNNTFANIIECKIFKTSGHKGGPQLWVEIEYEYFVGNIKYIGNKIAFGYEKSQALDFHLELYETLETKKHATIWYNPSIPEESVLIRKLSSTCFSNLTMGLLFFLFPKTILTQLAY